MDFIGGHGLMQNIFLAQMDYVSFVFGFACLLLFFVCVFLRQQLRSDVPWHYLGFFGLAHGINEWLNMLALGLGDSDLFRWCRFAIMAASFIFLLEFGRLTCGRLKNISVGRWVCIPAGIAIAGGFWVVPDTFLRWAGFPVQFPGALVVCVTAFTIWSYDETFRVKKADPQARGAGIWAVPGTALALVLLLALGWSWTDHAGQMARAVQKAQLLSMSQHVVTTIDPELVKELSASQGDREKPAYQFLKSRLEHLRNALSSVRFIYLVREVDGKIVFLVDSEPAGSRDESPPGQVYDEASREVRDVFTSGLENVAPPFTDRWGRWVSAYVPVRDGRSGELIAVMGVDRNARDFDLAVSKERLKGIALVGLMCLFIVVVLVYWFKFHMALAKSREDVRLILNSVGEAIYGIDLQGRCTFCNPACLRMLGYEDDKQLIGKNMHALCHHSRADRTEFPVGQCRICQAFKRGEGTHVDDEVLWRSDGSRFPVEYWSFPQLLDGKVVGAVVTFVDVSERKRIEEVVRKREAYLTSILDNFPYLAWLKDFEGRFLAVNSVFAKACGRNMQDIAGKTDFDVWPRALAESYRADDLKVMRERVKTVVEEPIASGEAVSYFETYKSPIFDSEGQVIGTTGFAHDITERKNAEKALRDSEERYRQIASAITDYIYTVFFEDGKPARTNYNSACWVITGYSSDEFRADPLLWIKIVVEEDRPLVLRQIEEIMTGKKDVRPIEHRIRRKDGQVCWVKNTIVLHHDAMGVLVSYDGLISDITARREAEKVLEDQKKALDEHAIVSRADSQGRITYVNDKFCQISKYTRAELIGQDHRIVNSGYHPKAFFVNMWGHISAGNVWQGSIRNRAKDGSYYWVRSTIVPFMDERGHVKEYISARTDITQNIENEERLEQAMQVRSNFVSTVSHELRTPLASIKSSVDILSTEAPGTLTRDQKTFLGRVKANIDRLARLINDVLDLSKLESGKMSMNLVPLHPEDVVKDVVEMQRAVIKNKSVALEMELEDGLPVFFADKDRLIQVLNNLLNNALKFTQEGKVTVAVSCDESRMMTFCVRDTGPGIREEDLSKLFQKFQQVGGASQQVSGTGLGLAISKEIVERHGGRIWAESRLGAGSSFIFTVPVKRQRRILVVDDDPGTLQMIKTALGRTGRYKVELAVDGFDAGQKFLEFGPDLVILDIGLPRLSGLEVCARIKRDPKMMRTKVIMVSSFTEDTEKKSWEAGADEILNKPVDPKELLEKISAFCREEEC